ncbi:NADPH-dependent F420 reductase [Propionibacteriaceae bacterium Y1700]|uniref:NADPH-dependent F420 reductase n=1 Tax=Microlunatus sp. Y1700 TaxID=3418487 RepID=UPI003DA73E53
MTHVSIGILGGTGPQGQGLARHLARSGHLVVLGSRDEGKAVETAAALGVDGITGGDNGTAADAEVVIVAVPYDGHAALLESVRDRLVGKIVIDCVNPLGFDKQGPYVLDVPAGSAAQEAQQLLPQSRVLAAFHHLSAPVLNNPDTADLDQDVLVLGEDRDDVAQVIMIAEALPGVRGVFAGRLRNAGQVEGLTANIIAINRRHKAHAGIKIIGLPNDRETKG